MISRIHSHIHHGRHSVFHDKMPTTLEYIQGLEDERRKIQVFERELPLCLQLVTEAFECKQKLLGKEGVYNKSDCSEQTSTDGPILEEFISLKRNSSSDYDEQHSQNIKEKNNNIKVHKNNDKAVSKKSDWLRSAQLWNQTSDPAPTENDSSKGVSVMEVNKNGIGGAFHPFKREKVFGRSDGPLLPATTGNSSPTPAAASSSTAETGGSNGGKSKMGEKKSQSQRKTRRSWSPELHKRFLRALKQLGGSNVATPKQIRELMKVDGLTNDEVKSHLQKYRLHNRRSNPSIHNNHPQQTQFVVVGGIWVPPPEYAAAMATTNSGEATGGASSNEIYAPIATLATHFQDESASAKLIHRQHGVSGPVGQESNCGGGADSYHNYQASSSSTETVTTPQD